PGADAGAKDPPCAPARRGQHDGRAGCGRELPEAGAGPRGDAGCVGADGDPPVHAVWDAADGGANVDPLRPPCRGVRGRGQGRGAELADQPRDLRVPASGGAKVRDRVLAPGQRDHPPAGARELCGAGHSDAGHRLAHAQRRRPGHARHRRGRRRCSRCNGRNPVGAQGATRPGGPAERRAAAVVQPQGRHPGPGRQALGARRHGLHRRVLWRRRRVALVHRHGDNLQHGRRDWRDHVRIPVHAVHGALPGGDEPRADRKGRGRERRLPERRRGGGPRPGAVLRRGRGDRPGRAGAGVQRAVHAGPAHAAVQDGRRGGGRGLDGPGQRGADRVVHQLVVPGPVAGG
ncbi:hypothetical protein IWQ56_007234, partial [Coemansia nantahalensis]